MKNRNHPQSHHPWHFEIAKPQNWYFSLFPFVTFFKAKLVIYHTCYFESWLFSFIIHIYIYTHNMCIEHFSILWHHTEIVVTVEISHGLKDHPTQLIPQVFLHFWCCQSISIRNMNRDSEKMWKLSAPCCDFNSTLSIK